MILERLLDSQKSALFAGIATKQDCLQNRSSNDTIRHSVSFQQQSEYFLLKNALEKTFFHL